jgi:hypothetical protein
VPAQAVVVEPGAVVVLRSTVPLTEHAAHYLRVQLALVSIDVGVRFVLLPNVIEVATVETARDGTSDDPALD